MRSFQAAVAAETRSVDMNQQHRISSNPQTSFQTRSVDMNQYTYPLIHSKLLRNRASKDIVNEAEKEVSMSCGLCTDGASSKERVINMTS